MCSLIDKSRLSRKRLIAEIETHVEQEISREFIKDLLLNWLLIEQAYSIKIKEEK